GSATCRPMSSSCCGRRPSSWNPALRFANGGRSSGSLRPVRTFTYAERPDLVARLGEVANTFLEFLGPGDVVGPYWGRLREELPRCQLVLWDDERDVVVGHARTAPAREADGLPGGVDDVLESWFDRDPRPEPDVLSALVAVVDRRRQGEGLSRVLVRAM